MSSPFHVIRSGWGFHVGENFARATSDTPIELAPKEYAKPGHVIGYIAGNADSKLGFLRTERVRVHIPLSAIASR